ncbi:MAG: endonuclease/exonuclease/phosphatase family protein [Labilithrix sp.]|nr:endonuclease/exonuclease/phosphatase family protein [Labilithrix sp.]MCW5816967.1 endonuclease/exonuclease/phosphatase family protein [Labilithrix sp.]
MRRPSFFALAFLALAACAAPVDQGATQVAASTNETAPRAAATSTTTTLRVVASNLTSGNRQSYDPGEGARILQALKPDVALMQEFNYGRNTTAELTTFVHDTFGAEYTWSRETGAAQIPNGVVSRYPIVAKGQWADPQTSTRSFAWARIDVPGDRDLWTISVHLLTSGASRRQAEANAIVARVRAEIPAGDYVVLGGDFNTGSRTEQCIRTFGSLFKTQGPYPVDTRGNGGTSASRGSPYDWVLASPALDALETPAVVGGVSFTHGMVFDSRNFDPLANVAPVRRSDSGAVNMQHMAVVRDFALPVPEEPPVVVEAPDAGATEPEAPAPDADASAPANE